MYARGGPAASPTGGEGVEEGVGEASAAEGDVVRGCGTIGRFGISVRMRSVRFMGGVRLVALPRPTDVFRDRRGRFGDGTSPGSGEELALASAGAGAGAGAVAGVDAVVGDGACREASSGAETGM